MAERRSSPLLRRKDGTVISTFKKRAIEISGEHNRTEAVKQPLSKLTLLNQTLPYLTSLFVCVSRPVSSLCNSAPGSGPSSPNSSNTAIANGNTGSVPNIQTEVCARPHRRFAARGAWVAQNGCNLISVQQQVRSLESFCVAAQTHHF